MSALPVKDPAEIKLVRFSVATQLEPGVAIGSTSVQVLVQRGVDAAPANVLDGVATISGTDVLQRVKGGVDDTDYRLRCLATDATGLVHLISVVLPVRAL